MAKSAETKNVIQQIVSKMSTEQNHISTKKKSYAKATKRKKKKKTPKNKEKKKFTKVTEHTNGNIHRIIILIIKLFIVVVVSLF